MSTEIISDNFLKAVKGPGPGIVWNLGKVAYKGAKATNTATKKREEIEKYKSELREIGLGDVNSVRNAWRQENITFDEYMAIVNILNS